MTETFSFNTIKNFDDHILASIPNYDLLFNTLLILSDYFIRKDTRVYDLGCSTGKLLKALEKRQAGLNCEYIGYDESTNLLELSKDSQVLFKHIDLNDRKNLDFKYASLIFSIFTLQFLNKEIRMSILEAVYRALIPGGAFIIAEKVYCEEGKMQDIFTSSYYEFKKKSFTEKQILDKEVDLRKILKPNYSEDLVSSLELVGFKSIQKFYKFLNFEAYICIKD